MKELIYVVLVILCLILSFAISSCQCEMRAGYGISSHYDPLIGCVFEKE